MRISKLKPSLIRRCGTRTGDFKHSLRLATVAVLLAAHPVATRPISPSPAPEPETLRGSPFGGNNYDCSAKGQIGKGDFPLEGDKKSIDDAIKLLEDCPACQQFYSKVKPVSYLKWLSESGKIIVTEALPLDWDRRKGPAKASEWPIGPIADHGWKPGEIALTYELSPTGDGLGKFDRPCIYINPSEFMVTGRDYSDKANEGLTLDQARALVMLHELAHAAGAIQLDGRKGQDPKITASKSLHNSLCVKRNCFNFPCAERMSICPAFPRSAPKSNNGKSVKSPPHERNRQ